MRSTTTYPCSINNGKDYIQRNFFLRILPMQQQNWQYRRKQLEQSQPARYFTTVANATIRAGATGLRTGGESE